MGHNPPLIPLGKAQQHQGSCPRRFKGCRKPLRHHSDNVFQSSPLSHIHILYYYTWKTEIKKFCQAAMDSTRDSRSHPGEILQTPALKYTFPGAGFPAASLLLSFHHLLMLGGIAPSMPGLCHSQATVTEQRSVCAAGEGKGTLTGALRPLSPPHLSVTNHKYPVRPQPHSPAVSKTLYRITE